MNLAEQLNVTATETLPSRLLPEILAKMTDISPIRVLDVGMGVHETVEYFGSRRCQLHFNSFHDALLDPPVITSEAKLGQVIDEAERQEKLLKEWRLRFRGLMNCARGTQFDLCLFWDFFNYLDDLALKAFAEEISPYIGSHTLGHAFVLLKPDSNVLNREYGILADDQIAMRPGRLHGLDAFPKPQARLAASLKGFVVSHSVLRRDGLLEASLKAG